MVKMIGELQNLSKFILSFKTWSFGPGGRNKAQPAIDFFCSFSLFAQRKEPKERAPMSLGPSGTLRALKCAGSLKTRCARTVQTP
jgi:hypothetical protein